MKNSFTIMLNSNDTTNVSNKTGTAASATFYVNWAAVIPEQYKGNKFKVTFSLRSENIADPSDIQVYVFVYVNIGSTYSYISQSSPSSCIGTVNCDSRTLYVSGTGTSSAAYVANADHNVGVMANYPSNNYVDVAFKFSTGNETVDYFPDYALQLNFELIE